MKKNVFSRTLAVLASMTVLGAASMISASAAGETISLSNVEGLPGEVVTMNVNVSANNDCDAYDFVAGWDDTALTAAAAAGASASEAGEGYVTVVGFSASSFADGAVASIDFTIPADAAVGTVYEINIAQANMLSTLTDGDITSADKFVGGTITVTEPATEAETTEAPTAAATTEAPAATTAAPATTVAKKTTGSPKTGVTGVALAVAGLVTAGATAVVLKKRH
jgi:hypothetical protein